MTVRATGRLRRLASRPRRRQLTSFERRDHSQNGEDGVIEEILRRIGAPGRRFVEFGVGPGEEGNCVRLADSQGWSGLFMEADEGAHSALQAKYSGDPGIRTRRERVSSANVLSVFAAEAVPPDFDLLSVDIDGNDYWVWQALARAFHPRLVVIEYNAALGPDAALVQPDGDEPWDGTAYFGASIQALRRLARLQGYRLVHTDSAGVNAFFVDARLAEPFAPEDAVPVHQPSYEMPPDPRHRAYIDLASGS